MPSEILTLAFALESKVPEGVAQGFKHYKKKMNF